ncbi:MAG: hypothetical protein WD696_18445 [Bryobacteraceae bacterium]
MRLPVLLFALAGMAHAETFSFRLPQPAEAIVNLEMSSPGSLWSKPGHEAAMALLSVDGRPSRHVMLFAGESRHTYSVGLGMLAAGDHRLEVTRGAKHSAAGSSFAVHAARFRDVPRSSAEYDVVAHSPILFARANTVGGFSDIPLLLYCERLMEDNRPLLQYTVVFSNEDGGTSTRALMARWGRTTDIEYIYKVWLDEKGGATIQSRDHKEVAFEGRREGLHPLLIPSTQNNMVSAEGESPVRYHLAPVEVDLSRHSREHVMDEHPVTWRVMAQELERENKVRPFGAVDGQKIGDPRHYLYVDALLSNRHSAMAVWVRTGKGKVWHSSHLGGADYAISRDGWVRTTVELPPGSAVEDLQELGFECLNPNPKEVAGTCRIDGVAKVFFLDRGYAPGPSFWRTEERMEIPTGEMRAFPLGKPGQ